MQTKSNQDSSAVVLNQHLHASAISICEAVEMFWNPGDQAFTLQNNSASNTKYQTMLQTNSNAFQTNRSKPEL